MPQNTREMIEAVRQALLEFDTATISDDNILLRLRAGYSEIYKHLVRSSDDWVSKTTFFEVVAGKIEYDIPKEVYNRRIEQIEIPMAPTAPYIYSKLEKIPYKEIYKFNLLRVRTYIPSVWAQNGDKFFIVPPPLVGYTAKITYTPNKIPLVLQSGQITNITGNVFTVDNENMDELQGLLSAGSRAYCSAVDYNTGDMKQTYQLESISGNQITVGPRTRSTYLGYPITPIQTEDITNIDVAGNVITLHTVNDPTSKFQTGDYVEIKYNLDTTGSYCTYDYRAQFETDILASINSGDDNNPPDFIVTDNISPFPVYFRVDAVTSGTVTFSAVYTPPFTEGYKTPAPAIADRVYKTCTIESSTQTAINLSGSDFGSLGNITVTLIGSGLPDIDVVVSTQTAPVTDFRILLTNTVLFKAYGATSDVFPASQTNSAGKTYTHVTYLATTIPIASIVTPGYGDIIRFSAPHGFATSGTVRVDLDDALTGYGSDIQRYKEATVLNSNTLSLPFSVGAKYNECRASPFLGTVTGIPKLVTYDTVFNNVYPFSIYKWTPNATTALTEKTPAFDPADQVNEWDYIVPGIGTCVGVGGEEMEYFMVQYAIYYVRSSLNEKDDEAREGLKMLLDDLRSNSAGRETGLRMKRPSGKSYTTVSRFRR